MFELFYDLVFVYAISRITAMIHHPVNGSIPLVTFLQFLLVVIVVMQIWLYFLPKFCHEYLLVAIYFFRKHTK